MRRTGLALVTLLSSVHLMTLAACGGEEATPPPKAPAAPVAEAPAAPPPPPAPPPPAKAMPSRAELQQQALGTALSALNGHDPKAFASVYADDAIISVAGLNDVEGREAIAANMGEWFDTFKDVKLGFSRVWAKGDTMVLEWVINGKHHGELFGVKGKEQPIGHYGLSVITFDDAGKVKRESRYGELGAVMTQVGGASAKARPIPAVPPKPEMIEGKLSAEPEGAGPRPMDRAMALFHALEAKEPRAFLGTLSPDVERDGLFHFQTAKGKDEAKRFFESFTKAFPDARFETRKTHEIGEYVIVESVLKATHKGQLGAIKPTGRSVVLHLADVLHVKDDQIRRISTYQNGLELEQQLGMFAVSAAGSVPASQKAPAKK